MAEDSQKDFYISHDKQDREWANWITWQLEKKGGYTCINPSWDFLAGSNLVHDVHEAIQQARCTLAVFSPNYLKSPSTQAEWAAAFQQDPTGKSGKLLPILVGECELQGLLASIIPIDLMQCDAQTALSRLLTGVGRTPVRPLVSPSYPGAASHDISEAPIFPRKNVLIASLGDSPAVISAMYDRLQEKLSIDQVVILCPEDDKDVDEDVKCAYGLVKRALSGLIAEDRLIYEPLPFRDADSWRNGCIFLKRLYTLLRRHQEKGDTVYLSLAGGRKSMAALMAWVVPFFPCIKNLYHIIDKEEQIHGPQYFLPVRTLARIARQSEKRFNRLMHPPCEQVMLVDIPFEKGKQIRRDIHRKLTSGSMDELIKGEYEEEQAQIVGQIAVQDGKDPLDVCVTEEAKQQFNLLRMQNPAMARLVKNGLLTLSEIKVLLDDLQRPDAELDTFPAKLDGSRNAKRLLRYFKGLEVPVHPVFYTDPHEIAKYPDQEIDEVVICSLEQEKGGTYRSLQEVKAARGSFAASDLFAPPGPADSVLIVPLGTSPMVATQLYTLLEKQELRTIRALVLIYPEQSQLIANGVKIIERLLPDGVHCEKAVVKGYEDIDSSEACRDFQQVLEQQIKRARDEYPLCKVDIALSGGRKGMTAMTLFAAQRQQIRFVYHTLVRDKVLSEEIEEETSIGMLNDLTPQQRKARLFLDDYKLPDEEYPYSLFTLFRVPVFPIED